MFAHLATFALLSCSLLWIAAPVAHATMYVGTAMSPSTPTVELEVTVDDVAATVTFVVRGPDNRWFAWGFDTNTMAGYSLIFEQSGGLTFHERNLVAPGNPGSPQAQQDLTLVGTTALSGVREVTFTRPLNTGDAQDYVFPVDGSTIDLIWGRGASDGAVSLAYHGTNKGKNQSMVLQEDSAVESRSWGSVKMAFRPVEENGPAPE